jgi:hypothetical protein
MPGSQDGRLTHAEPGDSYPASRATQPPTDVRICRNEDVAFSYIYADLNVANNGSDRKFSLAGRMGSTPNANSAQVDEGL